MAIQYRVGDVVAHYHEDSRWSMVGTVYHKRYTIKDHFLGLELSEYHSYVEH